MVVALTFVGVLATPAAGQWPDTSRQQSRDCRTANRIARL